MNKIFTDAHIIKTNNERYTTILRKSLSIMLAQFRTAHSTINNISSIQLTVYRADFGINIVLRQNKLK